MAAAISSRPACSKSVMISSTGCPGNSSAKGMQSRGIVQIQAHRRIPSPFAAAPRLSSTIEQGLEFHDYSAIPDLHYK
jgi:hypothetical protein